MSTDTNGAAMAVRDEPQSIAIANREDAAAALVWAATRGSGW